MVAQKISISLEASVLKVAREAASEEGVSLSAWLAQAAAEKARQRALREALEAQDRAFGPLTLEEAERIMAEVRRRSIVARPRGRRR